MKVERPWLASPLLSSPRFSSASRFGVLSSSSSWAQRRDAHHHHQQQRPAATAAEERKQRHSKAVAIDACWPAGACVRRGGQEGAGGCWRLVEILKQLHVCEEGVGAQPSRGSQLLTGVDCGVWTAECEWRVRDLIMKLSDQPRNTVICGLHYSYYY
mmetsp:Transcript_53845/g.109749  ORF Transcript_53845/g.109749 Transcript_53845/m.109749 type:complete len:157 (-) Transcript_53845:37-507(-)